jgi:hypothetical protein
MRTERQYNALERENRKLLLNVRIIGQKLDKLITRHERADLDLRMLKSRTGHLLKEEAP